MPTAAEQTETPRVRPESSHRLQCMEIWGGNRAIDTAFDVTGLDAWLYSQPYGNAAGGGDIHYVSLCGAGKISRFAVADVAGHGETADATAEALRRLMRKHINTPNQARFARALNEHFGLITDAGRFATALLLTYFAPTDHLIVVNAGHPRPLWYRAEPDRWQLLDHEGADRADEVANLPLGIIEPTPYHQFAVQLGKGDMIVVYTDSLMEAADRDGRQLGEGGLRELAERIGPGEPQHMARRLLDAVAEHRGGGAPKDDQTLLAMYHNAAEPAKMTLGDRVRVMAAMLGIGGA